LGGEHATALAAPTGHAGATETIVQDEIAKGHVPGAVVLAERNGRVITRTADGIRFAGPPIAPLRSDTIFDLASLTKAVATTPAILQLVERGKLALDRPVADYWPEFAANGKNAITIRQLLTHTSGLRADLDVSGNWSGDAEALSRIAAEHPTTPPGSRVTYSDVGFIVLGELVKRVSGEPLDVYSERHIFAPLGMDDTGFNLPASKLKRIAPTDREDGLVQDPTARRMGGVAGHAGLFSTAGDLARFAEMLLGGGTRKGVRILRPGSVALMSDAISLPGGQHRTLGWDVASPYSAGIDAAFAPGSYGHTGYTGTLLWVEPATRSFLVVLTSRLYPDAKGNARPLRERIASVLGSAPPPPVLAGIDVLAAAGFAPLLGKRIGLLSNDAARDARGRRTIDRLAEAPGVDLKALFSPEHGLAADREGSIAAGHDDNTGLPIHSLYGATRHPTDDMLNGLDALVIDLQDAGARFFTYPTTVAYVLEAASKRGLPVYLLDRPDPIDANIVQGPMLDPALKSFTGYFPLPLRPGMTLGELASMFNAEDAIGAKLRVIPMRGYRRSMWYDETKRGWTPPSPNLKSVEAAALYPAIGMIEGADISVGRGTDSPFALIGAPWIDAGALADALSSRKLVGLKFAPAEFTPRADAFAKQLCHGVTVTLTDRDHFDAGLAGLTIAAALHRLYPKQFDLDAITRLVGSEKIVADLKDGDDPAELAQSWQAAVATFRAVRAAYLLYP